MNRIVRCSGRVLAGLPMLAVCLWGTAESVSGLLQVLGRAHSRHALYAMTGHFDNPGPFGGFIAVTMAVAGAYLIRHRHAVRGPLQIVKTAAAAVAFAAGFLVLPASMSRGGWVALCVALAVAALRDRKIRGWIRTRRWFIPLATLLAAALCVGAFALKPDSALGRLHIWRMECRALAAHPLGTGPGSVLGTYGRTQEAFFRTHLDRVSPTTVRVAGCPEYAFNEYLHVGIEYGVPGLLVFAGVLGLALWSLLARRSVLSYGLIAWMTFALFSYPLSILRFDVLLAGFLVCAAVAAPVPAGWRLGGIAVAGALSVLVLIRGPQYPPFRRLFDVGYQQFQDGRYEEAITTLGDGAQISSDPMFHVIAGRCHEALGEVDAAAEEYGTAYYMVPCRLYPLVRLMTLRLDAGDPVGAVEIGEQIVKMPVNERHTTMVRLRDEAQSRLDSLKSVLP